MKNPNPQPNTMSEHLGKSHKITGLRPHCAQHERFTLKTTHKTLQNHTKVSIAQHTNLNIFKWHHIGSGKDGTTSTKKYSNFEGINKRIYEQQRDKYVTLGTASIWRSDVACWMSMDGCLHVSFKKVKCSSQTHGSFFVWNALGFGNAFLWVTWTASRHFAESVSFQSRLCEWFLSETFAHFFCHFCVCGSDLIFIQFNAENVVIIFTAHWCCRCARDNFSVNFS